MTNSAGAGKLGTQNQSPIRVDKVDQCAGDWEAQESAQEVVAEVIDGVEVSMAEDDGLAICLEGKIVRIELHAQFV